jgi:hypothetical protein
LATALLRGNSGWFRDRRIVGNYQIQGYAAVIEIKNISSETLEIIESVDTTVPGCRIQDRPFGTITIKPGESIGLLGHEPGVCRVIQPVVDPHVPRNGLDPYIPHKASMC